MTSPEILLKLVNSSGFLFQERVEEEVRRTYSKHGWEVLVREHRWESEEAANGGFIDLVLRRGNFRLVVECKRLREGYWVFLTPNPASSPIKDLTTQAYASEFRIKRKTIGQGEAGWRLAVAEPKSPASEFCVIRGKGDKQEAMLERLARVLIASTEAFGKEELELLPAPPKFLHEERGLFPVMITNARLFTCCYERKEIELDTGSLSGAHFDEVPMIRFSKSLVAPSNGAFRSLSEINEDSKRTIVIINVQRLTEVLEEWAP